MNILVVEDNPTNLKLLTAMLEAKEITVFSAVNGAEALQLMERFVVDAIISDILMPVMDGYELCMTIRKHKKFHNIPFIFYTATYTSPGDKKFSIEIGSDAFIKKPSEVNELLDAIKTAQSHPRREQKMDLVVEKNILREYNERLITKLEHKNIELDLAHSRLKNIFDNLDEVFFSFDPVHNRIIHISQACNTVYGYPEQAFFDNSNLWLEAIHRGDKDRINAVYTQLLKGISTRWECRIVQPGGEIRWIDTQLKPTLDGSRKVIRIDGIISDITNRKYAEEELMKLQKAVDASDEVIFMTDRNGVFTFVNPAFTRLYGYERTEIIGKATPRILKGGEKSQQEYEQIWKKILSKEHVRREMVNKTREGRRIIMETSVNPILNDTGEIIGFLAIQNDFTERQQVEKALRQSKDFAEHVIQTANVIFLQLDNYGKVLKLNTAAEEISGYSRLEIENKNWFETLVPRERYPYVWEEFLRMTSQGEVPRIFENPILTKSGEERQILWKNTILHEDNTVVGTISFGMDITERKQAEKFLQENEMRLRAIIESINEIVFEFDEQGTYLNIWTANEELLARSKNELLGHTIAETLGEKLAERFVPVFKRVIETGTSESLEYTMVTGEIERSFLGRISPVFGPNDSHQTVCMLALDISDRKKLESQLQQSQKFESLGTLASGVAHDFNNILGIVLGNLTLIERLAPDSENRAHSFESITKAVQRGAALVKQLLTFARKADKVLDAVDVNVIINEIAPLVRETFPKIISLELHLEKGLPFVTADHTQIHQIILNLCVNARDAMLPRGGILSLKTKTVSGTSVKANYPEANTVEYIEISVADTGTGMDEKTRTRIFEPFFTTKEIGKGTGLGLATVFGIVQTHHGFIGVESTVGKGTTFRIYFPVKLREIEVNHQNEIESTETLEGNETILLVEDEETLRSMITAHFEAYGYTVISANNGIEAIAQYRAYQPKIAVVISDLGLPMLEGDQLYYQLRELNPHVKFILATGYIEPGKRTELLDAGVIDVIHKPYDPAIVLRKIRNVLDAKNNVHETFLQ